VDVRGNSLWIGGLSAWCQRGGDALVFDWSVAWRVPVAHRVRSH